MKEIKSSPHDPGQGKPLTRRPSTARVYPFSAIVGQTEMKLGLILNVIDPSIGGILMMGHRGTGKSTAVRALADLLPEIWVARDCRYNCEPADPERLCDECAANLAAGGKIRREKAAVPVVDLPLGATEDRVCGAIDIQRALAHGVKSFDPGLLACANRGFLYIDEVNLLEDHLVDLLLDVAITGRNKVERENISVEHPARFVLVGSGNPEEGQLRPQLLDRFGLYVEVKTENHVDQRVEIVERREAFDRDQENFGASWEAEQKELRQRIARAARMLATVKVERAMLRQIAGLCSELKVDGHRGELTIMRAARAVAAFDGRKTVKEDDVRNVAAIALRHRLHHDALAETSGGARIEQALDSVFSGSTARSSSQADGGENSQGDANLTNDHDPAPHAVDSNGRNGGNQKKDIPAPAGGDTRLPKLTPAKDLNPRLVRNDGGRRTKQGRTAYSSQRGRYARAISLRRAGARIALDATLRALLAAGIRSPKQEPAGSEQQPTPYTPILLDALRFKQFTRKQGTLFIFAIDTSGSMALNRINQARRAILNALHESYVNRDSVAILGFRGVRAELLLPPSRSIVRARRVLDSLSVGGGTPLSAALACAIDLARCAEAQSSVDIWLLLFTDGHANVALRTTGVKDRAARRRLIDDEVKRLGSEMRRARIHPVVVDTQNAFAPNGDALALAKNLGARYFQMGAPLS